MQLALVSLLLVIIAMLVMRAVTRERKEYGQFKRLTSTVARQKIYRKWLRESFFMFGGLSAVVLLASWQFVPKALASARESPPVAWAVGLVTTDLGAGITLGVGVALAIGLVLPILLLRGHEEEIPTVGDVGALLPRTRGELKYGAGLAINAGLVEELLFRLALPALIFGILGNGIVAFVGATVLFGLLHIYQGWVGVVSSTVLGLVFCAIYLLSGSIILAIAIHALFDLRSLVLIPLVVTRVYRIRD
ncbi:CPBP family intramembrane glutamic endopeptidase [Glaciihabitans sp. dw_435]|uniref:CPBP family intramembrane glutamic endopeptidase n=1 Tax=Glaciihabitans sp. dw_435 TaxID=2720081 RepID=UPI001BD42D4D|nr:CPBP family intramembrane glutamic endopeptidase [Glaciihabitans sp. dw_435]